jgi:uncharacterized protein YkvS
MKIYILQENYSYTDYEAGWDENGVYEEEVICRGIIGVFPTLEEAVRGIAKKVQENSVDFEYGYGDRFEDYDIYVGNTENTSVRWIPRREYNDLIARFNDKQ